jgi:hypothetical protein
MRSDMAKVVTERPRRGHGNPSKKWGRRLRKNEYDAEDHGPRRAPIARRHQYGWNAKEFSDLLGPLRRYLRKQVRGERLLAPRCARPQHVEAHVRDDGGQPSAKIVDARGIGAAESQPRFLNGVVDLGQRAEHPVRHGAQVGSVLFESLGQMIAFVHRSHFLVTFRHGTDGRTVCNVTQGGNL